MDVRVTAVTSSFVVYTTSVCKSTAIAVNCLAPACRPAGTPRWPSRGTAIPAVSCDVGTFDQGLACHDPDTRRWTWSWGRPPDRGRRVGPVDDSVGRALRARDGCPPPFIDSLVEGVSYDVRRANPTLSGPTSCVSLSRHKDVPQHSFLGDRMSTVQINRTRLRAEDEALP